jgi:hypothetical protein
VVGATGPTLERARAGPADAGRYSLLAGDREGSTITDDTIVEVPPALPPPGQRRP